MPRVLVADDNTNIQKMVSLAFQGSGIEVTSVGNGEAAVRRLPDLNPDLILADIFMPVRNGYELCEWVKKDTKYSHIPVILLVGAFDPLDEKEARRVGADGVLKKPFIPPDPLIALVTSVLEKNPKIAKEIAKAKEAPAPPPPAAPMPVVSVPKIEVKPIPEFAEPSVDDASLAYGFGSGRRGLDEGDDQESAAARGPWSESEKEPGEEFDGASTTNDWRRSAMEFQIPEDDARRPAFSHDADLESAFPAEQQVPSQQMDTADSVEEATAAAQPGSVIEMPSAAPIPQAPSAPEPEAVAVASTQNPVEEMPAPPIADSSDEPAVAVEESSQLPASDGTAPKEPALEIQEVPVVKAIGEPERSFASRGSHWMDLMASSSEGPKGDWLSLITAAPVKPEVPAAEVAPSPTPEREAQDSFHQHAQIETQEPEIGPCGSPAVQEDVQAKDCEPVEEESFFADEPEANAVSALRAPGDDEPAAAPARELGSRFDKVPTIEDHDATGEFEPTVAEPVAAEAIEACLEIVSDGSDPAGWSTDPALIEAPAVHVRPEPLLVDESPKTALRYGSIPQEVAPVYAFLSPVEQAPKPTAVLEHSAQPEASEATTASFEMPDGGPEFSVSEFKEPRPIAGPPDREALAGIPFLNPPAITEKHAEEPAAADHPGSASPDVDAVVQRILEKLGPQLHEILSQHLLKPLIADLVQNQIEKKNS